MAELRPIQEEAFARYHETHEGHVNDRSARDEWAMDFFEDNFARRLPRGAYSVLDVGCGDGAMMRAFKAEGLVVAGTDLDPHNVRQGVFIYDVLKLPLKSVKFDVVVFMGIIEHLRKDDLLPSLRNLRSMLAPGGVLLITTQNMDSPMGDHFRYLDITHELGFTRESLCQVGRLAGFTKVEAYKGVHRDPDPPGLKRWAKRLWRRLYAIHVRVTGGAMADTWWDADTLVGVWHA
jgi:SAM-dependent methyltransferase